MCIMEMGGQGDLPPESVTKSSPAGGGSMYVLVCLMAHSAMGQ